MKGEGGGGGGELSPPTGQRARAAGEADLSCAVQNQHIVIVVIVVVWCVGIARDAGLVGEGELLASLNVDVAVHTSHHTVVAAGLVLEGAVVVDVAPGEGAVSVVVRPGPQDLHRRLLAAAWLFQVEVSVYTSQGRLGPSVGGGGGCRLTPQGWGSGPESNLSDGWGRWAWNGGGDWPQDGAWLRGGERVGQEGKARLGAEGAGPHHPDGISLAGVKGGASEDGAGGPCACGAGTELAGSILGEHHTHHHGQDQQEGIGSNQQDSL